MFVIGTLVNQQQVELQQQLSLDTTDSVIKLFAILQSNTTLQALRVKVEKVDTMGPTLEDM